MNKSSLLTDVFVEVEVASTLIGNPYVDLAPPDCMGKMGLGDGLREDVGRVRRAG